jgi:4'-phosphopantetheinyl transferase
MPAHIWRLRLDWPDEVVAGMAAVLAPDERERAGRFVFERDQRRYTLARGQLKHILGERLGIAAEAVSFAYGPYGKPRLAGTAGGLEFNLTHSADLALAAITEEGAIGIDLEYQRGGIDLEEIARRFFAPGEVARWEALPEAERPAAFYRCWTRKEAYLKAHGAGLSVALDSFEVTLAAGEAPRLVWAVDGSAQQWELFDVEVPDGFTAAGAVAGGKGPVAVMDRGEWWPGD